MFNNFVLVEALKEFFRVVVLSVIPVLITSLEKGAVDIKTIAVVGLIAGLRFIDKLLHEMGVEEEYDTEEESGLTKGLTRF